jgi:hypothetical protein
MRGGERDECRNNHHNFSGARRFVLQLSLTIHIIQHDKKICDAIARAE